MPLPGAEAAKDGFIYEDLWSVRCMIQVLNNKYEAVCSEPLGDDVIDYQFFRSGFVEYQQVKRQNAGSGNWSLALLKQKKVLGVFREKLERADAQCAFVSMQDANQLRELSERAEKSPSFEEFERYYLVSVAETVICER